MKKIILCELHHQVLRPWAELRKKLDKPPLVLTLDHHTDVMPAFRDPSCKIEKDAWKNPAAVQNAVAALKHDEHFDWAVHSGLISRAVIASQVNATPPANPELIIRCDERWQDENHVFADPERFRPLADSVLEEEYLRKMFGEIPQGPFILDIDCDYFATERSFHPQKDSFFRGLAEQACLITVSLERDWVRLLRFPGEHFTAEDVFHTLFPSGNL